MRFASACQPLRHAAGQAPDGALDALDAAGTSVSVAAAAAAISQALMRKSVPPIFGNGPRANSVGAGHQSDRRRMPRLRARRGVAPRPDDMDGRRILRNRQNAKRPRLSPDRMLVAFDGTAPGQTPLSNFDIQLVRLAGSGLRSPTRGPDWDLDAQWSPDGRKLAFALRRPHRSGPSP